jgi:hypothetical protein
LPSWNDGQAKQAILAFVRATTDQSSPKFAPPEARVATFDQDGALWVEHPMYTQVVDGLERVKELAEKKPELKNVEPFKTVLTDDRQMLEYTEAGGGARLMMLALHDDTKREYAYGPAQGLPETKVGAFTQALYDEAKNKGWTVISMKNDWNRIFAFEK